jgi:hypothetical protein
MNRVVPFVLALAPALVAAAAAAHPGHGAPHVVHESDLAVGWIVLGTVAVAAGVWALGKLRA